MSDESAMVERELRAAGFPGSAPPKPVQDYIDERPIWPDGTAVSETPMTAMQWRIWSLAASGKFFEGLVVFMTGVALPLIGQEYHVTAVQHGMVSSASVLGILIGAIALGSLADVFGRRTMFILEMLAFLVFLIGVTVSPNFAWLLVCLLGLGIALGCDYPTAHMMISESIPSSVRGRLVLAAFGFQALGALVGTIAGFLVLKNMHDIGAWRWMYALAIVPAALVAGFRFGVTESAPWLLHRGREREAHTALSRLLMRSPRYPHAIALLPPARTAGGTGYAALFNKRNIRATVLASVPWFLQDLGTYGIGIFTPTILAASLGHKAAVAGSITALISSDKLAAKGAAFIDVLLIVGIVAAVLLADKVGRIALQVWGFVGCAAGLLIASFSTSGGGLLSVFTGFMLFNFMTNLGPNAQTYLIAGEVFPTRIRGKGAGFAAAFAKAGAVTTAFLFPILLKNIGTASLLYILVGTSLLGAAVTWAFRVETMGKNLEAYE